MSVEMMELLVGIFFLGGVFTLIGMRIRYSYMERTRVSGTSEREVEHLAISVDSLRLEIEQLSERMEFTKLLGPPKTEE